MTYVRHRINNRIIIPAIAYETYNYCITVYTFIVFYYKVRFSFDKIWTFITNVNSPLDYLCFT